MFSWDKDKIAFFRDAAEYGGFNDALAAHAMAQFQSGEHICDAGCGLGYISVALAKHGFRVTAVDTSEDALRVLGENVAAQGIDCITIERSDVFGLSADRQFDGCVFCFFASVGDILRFSRRHCTGKTVIFKKNWGTHRFTVRETPIRAFTYDMTRAELDLLYVPYECETFMLDMGQPFRTVEDARRFFLLHDRNGETEMSAQEAERRLVRTKSEKFPFYLPAENPVGMIVIDSRYLSATI